MAISTPIDYPSELPCILKDGFGLKPVSPIRRTQIVTGRSRQRRAYTSTPTETDISLILDDAQSQIFEGWFRDVLGDGVAWFNFPLLTPIGYKHYVCRFTDIYQGPTPEGGMYWRYSATIELWERPTIPPGWGHYPEWLAGSSLLDIAINRDWPKA